MTRDDLRKKAKEWVIAYNEYASTVCWEGICEVKVPRMLEKLLLSVAREAYEDALAPIIAAVNLQAEDVALWSVPVERHQPISEAYLQSELRRLHELIESSARACAKELEEK